MDVVEKKMNALKKLFEQLTEENLQTFMAELSALLSSIMYTLTVRDTGLATDIIHSYLELALYFRGSQKNKLQEQTANFLFHNASAVYSSLMTLIEHTEQYPRPEPENDSVEFTVSLYKANEPDKLTLCTSMVTGLLSAAVKASFEGDQVRTLFHASRFKHLIAGFKEVEKPTAEQTEILVYTQRLGMGVLAGLQLGVKAELAEFIEAMDIKNPQAKA
jgi:hypothetical protein